MRLLLLLVATSAAMVLAACSPADSTPTPSPTASSAPTQRPATPSATRTPRPTPTPGRPEHWLNISAPTPNIVWGMLNGQRLFRSLDGGGSWEERPLPAGVTFFPNNELSFVDDQHGWLFISASPGTQCQAQVTFLWRTDDAGATWERLSSRSAAAFEEPPGVAEGRCKSALSFVDREHGFLGAWGSSTAAEIYRTSDGGHSWAPFVADPPGLGTFDSHLRMESLERRGTTLLVSAGGIYVYRSLDGGVSWSQAATVPESAGRPSFRARVYFLDDTHWWASGLANGNIVTTDDGATWQPAPGDPGLPMRDPPYLVFVNGQIAYAAAVNLLKKTVDGGVHWTDLLFPGP